ncbi:MAG: ATP-binding protein [Elusimicrobia bacterium]|nr:ATP-binding protein [Elusimicrobiota bacterium]
MNIPRNLLVKIIPFLKRKEFLAINGPRQAGKSIFLTLLQSYLIEKEKVNPKQIHILTFEDRKILRQFEMDPVLFIQSYLANEKHYLNYVMLDEFQYVEEGGQKLKLIFDTVKQVKVIVTGSSSLEIKAQMGKYMVGRILEFHLYPFSFGEALRAKDLRLEKIYKEHHKKLNQFIREGSPVKVRAGVDPWHEEMIPQLEHYTIWGGYPAVALSQTEEERAKVLDDIFNNYVLKDIKGLLELATDHNLFLLSEYLATQVGNIVVYNTLAQSSQLNYRQLMNHLNILQETFICKEVRPFFRNRQKELSKNPKIYFFDMGFRNNLLENMNGLQKRTDCGAMIENSAYIHLNQSAGVRERINFWRSKAGAEVDFVFHTGGEIIPLEVKYSSFQGCKITKSFASFLDCFKPKRGVVLTKNFWGKLKVNDSEILFAPVYYL